MTGPSTADDALRRVYSAAITCGLGDLRAALLSAMDRRIAASLPSSSVPAAQLYSDLFELDRIGTAVDGSVPLDQWLAVAENLSAGRPEAAVFAASRRPQLRPLETLPHALAPGAPIGREEVIARLAGFACATPPAPRFLTGPPGVGKTTVLEALVRHADVAARFGARRYLLRLGHVRDAGAIWAELGRITSALSWSPDTVTAALGSRATLVLLDGLDLVLDGDGPGLAQLVFRLASCPHIALAGSWRGPGGPPELPPQWQLPLAPLSRKEALSLFDRLAPEHIGEPARVELVDECDGLPVAVELIARAARPAPLSVLLGARRNSPAAVLLEGAAGARWAGVVHSAWYGPRMSNAARAIGGYVALLPGGLPLDDADSLLPRDGLAGVLHLLASGLARLDDGRTSMLRPVREVLPGVRTLDGGERTHLLEVVHRRARQTLTRLATAPDPQLAKAVRRDSENLAALATEALRAPLAASWIDLVLAMARARHGHGGARQPLRDALAAAERLGDRARTARCTMELAEEAADSSRDGETEACFRRAVSAFDQAGAVPEAMAARLRLGEHLLGASQWALAWSCAEETAQWARQHASESLLGRATLLGARIAIAMGRDGDAAALLQTAHAAFDRAGDALGRAACARRLGDTARKQGQLHVALGHYETARQTYEARGTLRGTAACLRAIAGAKLDTGDLDEARGLFARALGSYRELSDVHGEAHALLGCGDVALHGGDSALARCSYEEAARHYRSVGDRGGAAWCTCRLGDLALEGGDWHMASKQYEEALGIGAGDPSLAAACEVGLGDVQVQRGNPDPATAHYSRALQQYRASGDRCGAAECIRGLGDVARRAARAADAEAHYKEALEIFRAARHARGERECVERLALLRSAGAP